MSLDIEQLLAGAKPQQTPVPLLLRGDLRERWDQLALDLEDAPKTAASLGDVAPATAIAREMEALRAEMKAAEVPFLLRAVHPRRWAELRNAAPVRDKEQSDKEWSDTWHLYVCGLVAETCVDPVMSVEQVDRLCAELSNQQWLSLTNKTWELNADREQVPFSAAASALIQSNGGAPKQPGPPESRSPGSSAASPAKSPRSATTGKAVSRKR